MVSPPRLLVVAAAAVTFFAPRLGAQSDAETLARYRLTEAALVKFTQASRNFIAAAKADSTTRVEEEQDEDESPKSIAALAALYDGHPALKRAITSAGMTTLEFATFMMSMFQAGMAASLVEQQHGEFDKVPAGIPHENIRFYQRHEAELQRIGEELRAPEGKAPPEPEDPAEHDSATQRDDPLLANRPHRLPRRRLRGVDGAAPGGAEGGACGPRIPVCTR